MSRKHMGSSIDDFLKEEGIFEESQAQAVKEVVAWQLTEAMKKKKISKNKMAVDTLKFPRQTIDYKSGDCSDLSILYCALLESMQIETAFITVPGHIFMAVNLGVTPEAANKAFSHPVPCSACESRSAAM